MAQEGEKTLTPTLALCVCFQHGNRNLRVRVSVPGFPELTHGV